jgi:hypothetical protein
MGNYASTKKGQSGFATFCFLETDKHCINKIRSKPKKILFEGFEE